MDEQFFNKEITVKLTESDICNILMALDPEKPRQLVIGEKLAKYTSKDWQNVFNIN